jgi:hypothetical protein
VPGFWWDIEIGMSRYLAHAAGTPQFIEITDEEGKVIERPARASSLMRMLRVIRVARSSDGRLLERLFVPHSRKSKRAVKS